MSTEDDVRGTSHEDLRHVMSDMNQITASFSKLWDDSFKIQASIMEGQLGRWQSSLAHMTSGLQSILDQSRMTSLMAHLLTQQLGAISEITQITLQPNTWLPSLDVLKLPNPFAFEQRMEEASTTTGWLPYRTVPFAQFLDDSSYDESTFSDLVDRYYSECTSEIVEDISTRLSDYSVDDEDKSAVREALEVYRLGYFRSACYGVLPLIEKVIREDLLGIEGTKSGQYGEIQERVGHTPFRNLIWDGRHEWVVIKYIMHELYARVESENLEEIRHSPTPNRHAASHGFAAYNTSRQALNAIICADYVLRVASHWSSTTFDEGS